MARGPAARTIGAMKKILPLAAILALGLAGPSPAAPAPTSRGTGS